MNFVFQKKNGETNYLQHDVEYGDSVLPDTPLLLKNIKTNKLFWD